MSDLRKAAEMALEALKWNYGTDLCDIENCMAWLDKMNATIPALRQALEQPQWVCCVCGEPEALGIVHSADAPCFHYTKREWVGLMDDEIDTWNIVGHESLREFVRAIEAKLKERNT